MISVEDSHRVEEAKKCNTCLDWHHHCKSECCRTMFLNIDPERLNKRGTLISIRVDNLSTGDKLYYSFHGVKFERGFLRFPRKYISIIGRNIIYIKNCDMLEGNLCRGHKDNKPMICRSLTLENSKVYNPNFRVTDNCLFRYKDLEEKN